MAELTSFGRVGETVCGKEMEGGRSKCFAIGRPQDKAWPWLPGVECTGSRKRPWAPVAG